MGDRRAQPWKQALGCALALLCASCDWLLRDDRGGREQALGSMLEAGNAGVVDFSLRTRLRAGPGRRLCGTWTLQPMRLDAEGAPTPHGAPVVVREAASRLAVLSCVDSLDPQRDDFAYLVTAGDFADCDTQQPVAVVPPRSTQLVGFKCLQQRAVPIDFAVEVEQR